MVQSAEIMARWATMLAAESVSATGATIDGGVPASDTQVMEHTEAGVAQVGQRVPVIGAPTIDFESDAAQWRAIANDFTVKTRLMWQDGWFRDYDSVAREWSTQRDAMHLAPVFCGAAGWGHVEQLRAQLAQPPAHSSGWAPLSWPPVVMTLVGAAAAAKLPMEAAELAYRYIDGSYHSADSREPGEDGSLPGVTREYRRVVSTAADGAYSYAGAGIEGYGWGALSIHLIVRYILGLREEEAGVLTIAPMFPQALRQVGAVYRVGRLQWGKFAVSMECRVLAAGTYLARLSWSGREQVWEATWGDGRSIQL